MITNAILGVISNVAAFMLSPLTAIDFVLDLAASVGLFRLVIAIVKTVMNVIPFA